MGEFALLIFSSCIEIAVGLLCALAVASFVYDKADFKITSRVAAATAILGVVASLGHLGSPALAFNAIARVGVSSLSTEIVLAGGFMAIAILHAVLTFFPRAAGANKVVAVVGSMVGITTLLSIGHAYASVHVPLWDGMGTYVEPCMTAVSCGAILFVALNYRQVRGYLVDTFAVASLVAVIVQVAIAILDYVELGLGDRAAQASAAMVSGMGPLVLIGWVFVLGGASWFMWNAARHSSDGKGSLKSAWMAAGMLVIGQFIVRYLFYAAMASMSVGLI